MFGYRSDQRVQTHCNCIAERSGNGPADKAQADKLGPPDKEVVENDIERGDDEQDIGRDVHEVLRLQVSTGLAGPRMCVCGVGRKMIGSLLDNDITPVAWDTERQVAQVDGC